MAIFGVDVSEWQAGFDFNRAKAEGIKFAILRTTDGTYRDKQYVRHYEAAKAAGLTMAAYHYLRNPSEGTTVGQQVTASLAVMGDRRLPVWIDCETNAGLHVSHIRECKRLYEAAGIRVIGVYSYVPYWEGRIAPSEPDSHEFGAFWVAHYGTRGYGSPAGLYPGNHDHQWAYPLGNQKPALWQFGDRANVAGMNVDINAYRGTEAQLRVLFHGKGKIITPKAVVQQQASQEKVLPYSRQWVVQETGYWCGPASTQTVILSKLGKLIQEPQLARELRTHTGGTDYIGQFPAVLNRYLPAGKYVHRDMPNDPPTNAQRETLWANIRSSINGGYGVVANIVAPPSNYPKASYKSNQSPAYRGGTVYHYIAVMGYATDAGGARHVWVADSGFAPYGYWMSFNQLATLIPPKGYAYATATPPAPTPAKTTTTTTTAKDGLELSDIDKKRITEISNQLNGPEKGKDGMPTFKGWNINAVYDSAQSKDFESLTQAEMLAVLVKNQQKQDKALDDLRMAVTALTEAINKDGN